MAQDAVRTIRSTFIAALLLGALPAVGAPSLLAQTRATIQASAVVLPAPSDQQTQLSTVSGAERFLAAAPALQSTSRIRLTDRSGITVVSTQVINPDSQARATLTARPKGVRLTIEYAAN